MLLMSSVNLPVYYGCETARDVWEVTSSEMLTKQEMRKQI
jgi:hypothetical protein